MGSVNLSREPTSQQPDEAIRAAFRDIGQILAEARIEQHLTIEQVAAQIHIRQRYLIDLEEGQLADLPGLVYIFGFIRTYARLLNLDGEELIRLLRELPNLPNDKRSHVPVPMPAQEEPGSPVLIASIVLVIVMAVGGYFFLKPVATVSPPIASLTDEATIDDSKAQPAEEADFPSFAEEKILEAQQPGLADAAPSETPLLLNDQSATREGASPPANIPSVSRKKIIVKATEPSWIEIRDEAGRVIFMKVLKSDEEYELPEKPGVTMSTGNAGGLDIYLGDTKLPPLGARGDVKRGIRLETLQ